MIPLTHHDILILVAAFARHGRRVDLADSERSARKIVFQTITHTEVGAAKLTLVESLYLENPRPERYRAVRQLRHANGTTAYLQVDGPSPEAAYERVLATPPESQFTVVAEWPVAHSYTVDLTRSSMAWLTAAEANIGTVQLRLATQAGGRVPAELTLHGADDYQLPEDVLAVLGWAWRPLRWRRGCWNSLLHVTRREPQCSLDLQTRFDHTVAHLATTLAAAPGEFHPRFKQARWRAAFQRALPLLACAAVLASLPLLQVLLFNRGFEMPPWVLGLPPLLLVSALLAGTHHIPEIVVPPLPRPLKPDAWPQINPLPERTMPPDVGETTETTPASTLSTNFVIPPGTGGIQTLGGER